MLGGIKGTVKDFLLTSPASQSLISEISWDKSNPLDPQISSKKQEILSFFPLLPHPTLTLPLFPALRQPLQLARFLALWVSEMHGMSG